MPVGQVEFWVPSRSEGAIRGERHGRLRFTAGDLVGLHVGAIRFGLEVAYDVGPSGTAIRVRLPQASFLSLPAELDRDDPLLKVVPLPGPLRDLSERYAEAIHPGLRLDKYLTPAGNQEGQKRVLSDVAARSPGDVGLFDDVSRRRRAMLDATGTERWRRRTASPLTLHLARASALENAGLCLHPVYGFTFLPGTGLKGLARAYAETVWRSNQPDPAEAAEEIARVFGHIRSTPGSESDGAAAGAVIFHDAWPESWPRLIVDIVNNHHGSYYQGKDAPGDWESPRMVYFLAVPAGQEFSFALGKRRVDVDDRLLQLARTWLDGGLTHLGCGAKTASGYGYFAPGDDEPAHSEGPDRKTIPFTLSLETPAFLAGSDQASRDACDLRPATLRGLLRWWWRTLHAGALDIGRLRDLEAMIWGSTTIGGAVQVQVKPSRPGSPVLYRKRERADMPPSDKAGPYGIPGADPRKTTQGLWYASFGMDDAGRERSVIEPGAEWALRLTARASRPLRERGLDVGDVLDQARAALWLLCQYGGVGSKSRKGFGSLSANDLDDIDLDRCRRDARELRKTLGMPEDERPGVAQSPALCDLVEEEVVVDFAWPDAWSVLDQVGFAYQAFAKRFAHDRDHENRLIPTWAGGEPPRGYTKASLGVPRKIPDPRAGGRRWASERHASPAHIHVSRIEGNAHRVRVVAFAAPRLPSYESSVAFLREFLDHLRDELGRRSELPPRSARSGRNGRDAGRRPAGGGRRDERRDRSPTRTRGELHGSPAPPTRPSTGPKAGDLVEAVLLPDRTKKGGWKARHEPTGLSGPIVNSDKVPDDKNAGDVVVLVVHSANPREIMFRAR